MRKFLAGLFLLATLALPAQAQNYVNLHAQNIYTRHVTLNGQAGPQCLRVDAGGNLTPTGKDCLTPTNPTDLYIATTGSDSTGTGASGAPYRTLSHALATLFPLLTANVTVHIADGTYAEPASANTLATAGTAELILQGNTTTPANVVFASADGIAGASIQGHVAVRLKGMKIQPSVSTANGIAAGNFARLEIEKVVVGGTLTNGVVVSTSQLALYGDLTVSGFSGTGLLINNNSMATTNASSLTVTLTGPGGTTAKGVVLTASRWFTFNDVSSINLTITGTEHCLEVVLTSMLAFTTTGTITCTNPSTPANSAAVYESDNSSTGINSGASTVFDHWTYGFNLGSISYAEHVPESGGIRTWTNIGTNVNAVQNSVGYLP